MPCYDSFDDDRRETVKEMKRRLDLATRLLCEHCKYLEDAHLLQYHSQELKDWWAKHKTEDVKRNNKL